MSELYHHGVKGQKWGVRRYQNEDGSLTPAGIKRYSKLLQKRRDADSRLNSFEVGLTKNSNNRNRREEYLGELTRAVDIEADYIQGKTSRREYHQQRLDLHSVGMQYADYLIGHSQNFNSDAETWVRARVTRNASELIRAYSNATDSLFSSYYRRSKPANEVNAREIIFRD